MVACWGEPRYWPVPTPTLWHIHASVLLCLFFQAFLVKTGNPLCPALSGLLKVINILMCKQERMCAGNKPHFITCYFRKTQLLSGILEPFQTGWHCKVAWISYSLESGIVIVERRTESTWHVIQRNLEAHSSWEVLRLITWSHLGFAGVPSLSQNFFFWIWPMWL